jgi:multidrug resistance protein MdtO
MPSATPGFADFALLELERTLDDMEAAAGFLGVSSGAGASRSAAPSALDRGNSPFFLTPACSLSNAPALRYGFKGGLAAALAFFAVEALHAPGIGTAVVTCVLVAQSSFGAMVRKAGLRLLGATIGGLLGILTIVYAMPQMDTIASLLVITALVCGLASWVLAGSVRISYAGIQIGLAWVLTALVAVGPSTDLASPLDRVIGILVGILITFVVFSTVWPELASDGLRSSLVSALRHMGQLSRVAISEDDKAALSRPSGGFRFQVTHDFLDALRFATESRLEPQTRSDLGRAAQEALVQVLDASQSAFLALHAVVRRRLDAGVFPGSRVDAALLALAKDIKPFLDSVALRIETGRETPAPELERALAQIREAGEGPGREGAPEEPGLPELRVRLLLYGNLVTRLRRLETRSREFAERARAFAGSHRGDSRADLSGSRAERADGHGAGGVG